jgi:hypothetical protein
VKRLHLQMERVLNLSPPAGAAFLRVAIEQKLTHSGGTKMLHLQMQRKNRMTICRLAEKIKLADFQCARHFWRRKIRFLRRQGSGLSWI